MSYWLTLPYLLLGVFPAARRIFLPLLPEIGDITNLLSDALHHGASTRWLVVRVYWSLSPCLSRFRQLINH